MSGATWLGLCHKVELSHLIEIKSARLAGSQGSGGNGRVRLGLGGPPKSVHNRAKSLASLSFIPFPNRSREIRSFRD
jgi:hypothetical protein